MIGLNFQNEVSLERSIFVDVTAYQLKIAYAKS